MTTEQNKELLKHLKGINGSLSIITLIVLGYVIVDLAWFIIERI